jgi:hypothetical protein
MGEPRVKREFPEQRIAQLEAMVTGLRGNVETLLARAQTSKDDIQVLENKLAGATFGRQGAEKDRDAALRAAEQLAVSFRQLQTEYDDLKAEFGPVQARLKLAQDEKETQYQEAKGVIDGLRQQIANITQQYIALQKEAQERLQDAVNKAIALNGKCEEQAGEIERLNRAVKGYETNTRYSEDGFNLLKQQRDDAMSNAQAADIRAGEFETQLRQAQEDGKLLQQQNSNLARDLQDLQRLRDQKQQQPILVPGPLIPVPGVEPDVQPPAGAMMVDIYAPDFAAMQRKALDAQKIAEDAQRTAVMNQQDAKAIREQYDKLQQQYTQLVQTYEDAMRTGQRQLQAADAAITEQRQLVTQADALKIRAQTDLKSLQDSVMPEFKLVGITEKSLDLLGGMFRSQSKEQLLAAVRSMMQADWGKLQQPNALVRAGVVNDLLDLYSLRILDTITMRDDKKRSIELSTVDVRGTPRWLSQILTATTQLALKPTQDVKLQLPAEIKDVIVPRATFLSPDGTLNQIKRTAAFIRESAAKQLTPPPPPAVAEVLPICKVMDPSLEDVPLLMQICCDRPWAIVLATHIMGRNHYNPRWPLYYQARWHLLDESGRVKDLINDRNTLGWHIQGLIGAYTKFRKFIAAGGQGQLDATPTELVYSRLVSQTVFTLGQSLKARIQGEHTVKWPVPDPAAAGQQGPVGDVWDVMINNLATWNFNNAVAKSQLIPLYNSLTNPREASKLFAGRAH